ncbi:MAG: hypothetical protein H6Q59_1114 [Firmicutes bacterium]|nr:hypothetical protein [Bacillota bacterium]
MRLAEQRELFTKEKRVYESKKLKFLGVDGFDVYNSSVPFWWNGKRYIYGRVEKREDWARSWVRLFEETDKDEWTLVQGDMIYQLEDPYISIINEELVLGGTHVRKRQGMIDTYYGYFYKGKDIHDLVYFTTGPDYMKDIRLVELSDKRIGVFSRPRSEEIRALHGSESIIGFTIINDISELNAEIINNAIKIDELFEKDEWGGCNQCYLLDSGKIGVIGHMSYKKTDDSGHDILVYRNISFVYDIEEHLALDLKIIGTRNCYPEGPAKRSDLIDCAFTSGIVMREDGKADLYSGIGDTEVGRITIDYPFEGYGKIIS